MGTPPLGRLQHYLSGVTDNRQSGKVKHQLKSVLFIAVVGTITNAGSWEEIEQFGKGKESWFRQYVDLPCGAPSNDTFERVFRWIDGKEFERCFILWMREICQDKKLGIMAIDGKTMRGSGDRATGRNPLHIVSAWTSENNLVLGQVKTEEKSNEVTAIPALLELLDVKGAIVTIDAMGTQKELTEKIIQKKADYVLSVKKIRGICMKTSAILWKRNERANLTEWSTNIAERLIKDTGGSRNGNTTYSTISNG